MGTKPAMLSLSYSPAEQIWYDSEYGVKCATYAFSHVPRWNDRIVICDHTYRVTRVYYKINLDQRYPYVSAEWVESSISIEDELGALQESVLCKDCRIDAVSDGMFMVRDEMWEGVVPEGRGALLCLSCFERRLGRRVASADLIDAPVNDGLRRRLGEEPPRLVEIRRLLADSAGNEVSHDASLSPSALSSG